MKVVVATLLLAFFSFKTLAADTTIVKLMQKVVELNVPKYYRHFYLLEPPDKPRLDEFILEPNSNSFLSVPHNEFIENNMTDTVTFKWSTQNLPRAKCVDRAHLPKHVYSMIRTTTTVICSTRVGTKEFNLKNNDTVVVFVRANTSQKKVDKAVKKATIIHYTYCDKINAALPIEERNYFVFSRPIFSKDKQYAYVEISRTDGGSRCILKNNKGSWEVIREISVAY